jgi:hypothetical protein
MPPIIRFTPSGQIREIIGMCIRNEIVLDFIELVFIVFVFVLVLVDFGFDIEELVSAFTSTLSSVAL